MKFKHRALALILSMMMVLTFMPAMAFADDDPAEENPAPVAEEVQEEAAPAEAEEPAPAVKAAPALLSDEDGDDFDYDYDGDDEGTEGWFEAYEEDGWVSFDYYNDATLEVCVSAYDYETTPTFTFKWYDSNDKYLGNTPYKFTVSKEGEYYCVVSDGLGQEETVYFDVFYEPNWDAYADDWSMNLEEGKARLVVDIDKYDDENPVPKLTYTWYDKNRKKLTGTSRALTVTAVGTYYCVVSDGKGSQEVSFNVYNHKYWYIDERYDSYDINPGETQELTVKLFVEEDEYGYSELPLPTFKYEWFRVEEDEYGDETGVLTPIGTNSDTYAATDSGTYRCVVTDDAGNTDYTESRVYVRDASGGWVAYPADNEQTVYLTEAGEATLSVVTETIGGAAPTLSYSWFSNDNDYGESVPIGGNTAQINVNETGSYFCQVSDGNEENSKSVWFYVQPYDETPEGDVISASYQHKGGPIEGEPDYYDKVISYLIDSNYDDDFDDGRRFLEGDTVTVVVKFGQGTKTKTYTCRHYYDEEYDDEGYAFFSDENGEDTIWVDFRDNQQEGEWTWPSGSTQEVEIYVDGVKAPETLTVNVPEYKALVKAELKLVPGFEPIVSVGQNDGVGSSAFYGEGNQLVATYSDGSEKVYTFTDDVDVYGFADEDNNRAWFSADLEDNKITLKKDVPTELTFSYWDASDNDDHVEFKYTVTAKKYSVYATTSPEELQYTGKVIKPSVVIKTVYGNKKVPSTAYKCTFPKSKAIGEYNYKVTIKDTENYMSEWDGSTVFWGWYTIVPKKIALSKLTAGKKAFTARWKKLSGKDQKLISGIAIEYSLKSNFSNSKYVYVKKNAYTKTIKKLKAKKYYYVRIYTYKNMKYTWVDEKGKKHTETYRLFSKPSKKYKVKTK